MGTEHPPIESRNLEEVVLTPLQPMGVKYSMT